MKQDRIPRAPLGGANRRRREGVDPAESFRPAYRSAVAVGLLALGLTYLAHADGSPITAALVAVFGVIIAGALLGARAGIFAGLAASLVFNLAFTDPPWTFTYTKADDLVPMIALTVSAIGSGVLAGRLRDRAIAAEVAGRRIAQLLGFSQDLQSAVTLLQVESTAQQYLGSDSAQVRLFVEEEGVLEAAGLRSEASEQARTCWEEGFPSLTFDDCTAHLLARPDRRSGVLLVEHEPGERAPCPAAFLPLILLAVERCQLAQKLARTELIRRSEQFKTALLSSVSHDLRTPLSAISASASSLGTIGDELDASTRADLIQTIQEQCARLDRFTRNLLNLGRIDAGLDADLMPMSDAIEILGGTLARVRKLTGVHAIHREFSVASAPVRAHELLLEQLFLNVLENAITHTPAGTSVRVSTDVLDGFLVVAVEDDGPGIPVEERDRVFERFHQVDVDGRRGSGSGLGLSIARGFTELFGGTIRATSATEPMRGARIEISLPLGPPLS